MLITQTNKLITCLPLLIRYRTNSTKRLAILADLVLDHMITYYEIHFQLVNGLERHSTWPAKWVPLWLWTRSTCTRLSCSRRGRGIACWPPAPQLAGSALSWLRWRLYWYIIYSFDNLAQYTSNIIIIMIISRNYIDTMIHVFSFLVQEKTINKRGLISD